MSDIFKEQMVKRHPGKREFFIKVGIVVLAVCCAVFLFSIPVVAGFAPILVLGFGFGAFYLFSFFNVEYEYIYTNGDLDIDVIYAKSRRKRVFAGNVRDFELMAPVDDTARFGGTDSGLTVKDFTSGIKKENTYAFLVRKDGNKLKILIEPNEIILKAMSLALTPRKFFGTVKN